MKKAMGLLGAIFLLGVVNSTNVSADLVLPAIANQFAVSFAFIGAGWWCSIIVGLLIVLVEAHFVKRLLTIKLPLAFVLSFMINFVTSVVGIMIAAFAFSGQNIFAYGDMRFGTYLGMIPGYVFTVLIEGLLLLGCSAMFQLNQRIADCYRTAGTVSL
ncbi:MAG: hypothetical protein HQL20_06715 [Candidatus Omnitrophica bacterium]|nr:hypothetical protein [Candidatus Omnitrophota bacterium]